MITVSEASRLAIVRTSVQDLRRAGRGVLVSGLDVATAADVLRQLHDGLGEVDPDARAIVALSRTDTGTVALTDVTLHDNGILEVPDPVDGLVVVTAEDVAADGEVLPLRQLVCILPDGQEVGLFHTGREDEPATWTTADEDQGLRPRDLASNTARRALGLPSVVEPVAVTDILARVWLMQVAETALARFDAPEGPHEVSVDDVRHLAARSPLDLDDEAPTWEELRVAAAEGRLTLGPFSVDRDHAAWLDADGFAQMLDRTLPSLESLLGSLEIVGDPQLLAWTIGWLAARDWYDPAA